jgi:hypothetical protein
MLIRYWFEFGLTLNDPHPPGFLLGCGVTAVDYSDALSLIRAYIGTEHALPPIRRAVDGVDVSTLDDGHVLPNMGIPAWRGVWFPL